MRRATVVMVAVLVLVAAACGGDDDDGGSGDAGSGSEAAASGDFCEVWPSLNEDQAEITGTPTPEQLESARALLQSARDAAPGEIADEVDQMVDAIERLVDAAAEGDEPDMEEMFGEIFAIALTVGPPVEAWLVENCPDYEPESGIDDDPSDDVGVLDIPRADLDAMLDAVVPERAGAESESGFGNDKWKILVAVELAPSAVAMCEDLSSRLADHADASGTLTLTIAGPDGDPIVVNEKIEAGDAGECVEV